MNDLTGEYAGAAKVEDVILAELGITNKTDPMYWFVAHDDDEAFYRDVPLDAQAKRAQYQASLSARQPG